MIDVTMAGPLLALLHLSDTLFPIGGFGYSDGLEAATAARLVETPADLQAWLGVCLDELVGRMDGPAVLHAWSAFDRQAWRALCELDEEIAAMRPSSAVRHSSRAIFFDEMDALSRTRGSSIPADVEHTIVPQFLTEVGWVEGLRNVVVIGASNRLDLIDPAILRPGRLDVKIKIDRPDRTAAGDIFHRYLTGTSRPTFRSLPTRSATTVAKTRGLRLALSLLSSEPHEDAYAG